MQQSTAFYILRGVQRRCVWAVGRLGVAACVAAAAVDRQARQSCLVWCGGRTALPDPLRLRPDCLVWLSGRLNSHRHTRHDKAVLSVSCLAWRCELDNCPERVQTSDFLSATVLSCRESNSHRRGGRDTYKTVLSCLACRCEFAFSPVARPTPQPFPVPRIVQRLDIKGDTRSVL